MNRRKVVQGSVSTWFECEEHNWTYGEEDEKDNCPVCYGEKLAEVRIIKQLNDRAFWLIHLDKLAEAEELQTQIALIKGEK